MFIDTYAQEDYGKKSFDCKDGENAILIRGAKVETSKQGKRMLSIELKVDTSNGLPYTLYYPEGEFFNKNLTRFFDAFKIPRGNFNFAQWVGKSGKGMFIHKENTFTGQDGIQRTSIKAELSYLVVPEQQQQTGPQYPSQMDTSQYDNTMIF